jgi:hypothetical protein
MKGRNRAVGLICGKLPQMPSCWKWIWRIGGHSVHELVRHYEYRSRRPNACYSVVGFRFRCPTGASPLRDDTRINPS